MRRKEVGVNSEKHVASDVRFALNSSLCADTMTTGHNPLRSVKGIDKLTSRRGPTLPDTARFSPYLDGRAHSDAILNSALHEIPTFLQVNS